MLSSMLDSRPRLSTDLREAFPDMQGLSPRNPKYMRAFAAAWPDRAIVQQLAAQIPWFHNCILLDRVQGPADREWYIRQTIQNGWSRNILALQIESRLHGRQGKAVTIGLLDKSPVHPREVFADVIADRAAAVIFAHNHPSGELQPSDADLRMHEQLTEAGKILGLRVLDHVIVTRKGHYSFQEAGLIR